MMLSVLMITYNHEKFVAQALESVLMQQVDFPYEIVIGDDCSTDGTREILLRYREKYPDRIRLLLPEKNLGAVRNLVRVLEACRGRYVALLEGDDFWTAPDKARRQVEFLERHRHFAMCFTNSSVVDEEGSILREDRLDADRRRNLSQVEILCGLVPPVNTALFRKEAVRDPAALDRDCVNGDILLFSAATEMGDAAYLDCRAAAYRVHGGGIWSRRSAEYLKRNLLKTRVALLQLFDGTHRGLLLPQVQCCYRDLMEHYKSGGSAGRFAGTFAGYFLNNLRYGAFSPAADLRYLAAGLGAALVRTAVGRGDVSSG